PTTRCIISESATGKTTISPTLQHDGSLSSTYALSPTSRTGDMHPPATVAMPKPNLRKVSIHGSVSASLLFICRIRIRRLVAGGVDQFGGRLAQVERVREFRAEQQHPEASDVPCVVKEIRPTHGSGGGEHAGKVANLSERHPAVLGTVAGLKQNRIAGTQHANAPTEDFDLGGSIPKLLARGGKREVAGRQAPVEIDDTVRAREFERDVGEKSARDYVGTVGGRRVPDALERRDRARQIRETHHEIQVSEHPHRDVAVRCDRESGTLDCNRRHASGREGIDDFDGAARQMVTSQRVGLVAQPKRADDMSRQIGGALSPETGTDHRGHAVAIGEREKSIPI